MIVRATSRGIQQQYKKYAEDWFGIGSHIGTHIIFKFMYFN